MAKKIEKKSTRKSVVIPTISINRDGEKIDVQVQTTCKTFGTGILLDVEGNFKSKCITCAKKRGEVAEACSVACNPEGFELAKKNGRVRPFDCAIEYWLMGENKETIIETMVSEYDMKDTAAKRFANDIFSVGNVAIGKARKKGGLIERYLNWAVYGIGDEPTGCKATIGFCKQYAPVFKEMTV